MCVYVCVCVCVCVWCVCGSGVCVCVPNMLRNQKLPGQSRTFFFHMSKQLVIAYDLCLQCVGGQMISKHFLIRENEASPASVSQPGRVEMLGWGGLITLILFTDAKENRANARLKATKLKKRRGLPSSCLLYTSPSPRDKRQSRMPSSA